MFFCSLFHHVGGRLILCAALVGCNVVLFAVWALWLVHVGAVNEQVVACTSVARLLSSTRFKNVSKTFAFTTTCRSWYKRSGAKPREPQSHVGWQEISLEDEKQWTRWSLHPVHNLVESDYFNNLCVLFLLQLCRETHRWLLLEFVSLFCTSW